MPFLLISSSWVYAFLLYTSVYLNEIQIGESVTSIDHLFKYMHYYGKVTINPQNPNYVVENNILYNKDKTTLIAVLNKI